MATRPPRYKSLYELGRGGMGSVDLAEDDRGELVAVKRMLPELLRDDRSRSMFLREARLLARIDHPNVVRTVEVDPGDEEEAPSIVMEFVSGVSLRDALEKCPSGLPISIAARIALGVASGLHAAHELRDEAQNPLGVVHRDVSPHNVLLTFDGKVKLLDFGVAKTTEGTQTNTGEVKGKVSYMAPEQAMAEPVDRRSDIYALGSVLYEMLTGRRMHGEGTDMEILRRMAMVVPPRVRELRNDVPQSLDELVSRMTTEAKDARPATALEVARALEKQAADAPEEALAKWVAAVLPEAVQGQRDRESVARSAQALTQMGRRARPARMLVMGAGVALAIGGAAAGALLLRQERPPSLPAGSASALATTSVASSSPSSAPSADGARVDLTFVVPPNRPAGGASSGTGPHARPSAGAVKVVLPKVDDKPF